MLKGGWTKRRGGGYADARGAISTNEKSSTGKKRGWFTTAASSSSDAPRESGFNGKIQKSMLDAQKRPEELRTTVERLEGDKTDADLEAMAVSYDSADDIEPDEAVEVSMPSGNGKDEWETPGGATPEELLEQHALLESKYEAEYADYREYMPEAAAAEFTEEGAVRRLAHLGLK